MKLHLLATVLLNVSISGVASAEKMLRTRDVECPKNQIQCQVSDNPRCRRKMDRSPDCRNVKWQTVCCTKNCKPSGDGGRVCETAPKSSSEGYGFGYVAYDEEEEDAFVTPSEDTLDSEDLSSESEDYAGDEDEEEFDSEDVDAFFANKNQSDCWRLGANSRERLGCGNRSGNNRNSYRPRNDDRPRSSNSSSNGHCGRFSNRNNCESRNHCKWVIPNGRMAAYCTHRRWEDALDSKDVSSESEDYVVDEDLEEFDSGDLASEDSADDNEDEEDTVTVDIDFQNRSFCVSSGRGFRFNRRYFHTRSGCCIHEFHVCKVNKNFGFGGSNCARIKQNCFTGGRDGLEDEDMKEFDSDSESQDLASEEDFVDHEDEENTEDIDFYYYDRCNPDKDIFCIHNGYGYGNGYDDGYGDGNRYGNGSNRNEEDCLRKFLNCKDDKSFGNGGTNCATMYQQCYDRRPYVGEVA